MKQQTTIKICGIRRPETLLEAQRLGVDAVGFVLYPPSPRYVELAELKKLQSYMPPFMNRVGLLVNPTVDQVKQVLSNHWVDVLQFHGGESGKFCEQFGFPYLKALPAEPSMREASFWQACLAEYPNAKGFLVDTPDPRLHGGTGRTFNWDWWPEHVPVRLILAGGLNAGNVEQAIAKTRPYAVDVSGGVEHTRGEKSLHAMQDFVRAVRRADNESKG